MSSLNYNTSEAMQLNPESISTDAFLEDLLPPSYVLPPELKTWKGYIAYYSNATVDIINDFDITFLYSIKNSPLIKNSKILSEIVSKLIDFLNAPFLIFKKNVSPSAIEQVRSAVKQMKSEIFERNSLRISVISGSLITALEEGLPFFDYLKDIGFGDINEAVFSNDEIEEINKASRKHWKQGSFIPLSQQEDGEYVNLQWMKGLIKKADNLGEDEDLSILKVSEQQLGEFQQILSEEEYADPDSVIKKINLVKLLSSKMHVLLSVIVFFKEHNLLAKNDVEMFDENRIEFRQEYKRDVLDKFFNEENANKLRRLINGMIVS